MKAIIFGHTGQDGWYLTNLLQQKGIRVYGVSRSKTDLSCNLGDHKSLIKVLGEVQPDYIFHFAAISTTKHGAVFDNHSAIGTGTLNLLEAARIICPNSRIFLSGSGLQFVNDGSPLDENSSFDATSSYSVERNYTYYLGKYYRNTFDMNVFFGFFFTHDSPRRTANHMTQKIVMAAKEAASGIDRKLVIGNIDVRKEYLYAGDAVSAVWFLVNQDQYYEAVIGSGVDYSIKDWVSKCYDIVGLDWRNYIVTNDSFIAEYTRLVSNPMRLFKMGWHPQVDFSELAHLMMEGI